MAIFPALFSRAIEASWQAAVIAVLAMLLQFLLRDRIAPRWRCALWMLVFVRLALPALPSSSFSIFNLHPPPPPAAIEQPADTSIRYGVKPPTTPNIARNLVSPMAVHRAIDPFTIAATLWIAVACALLIKGVVGSLLFRRKLNKFDPSPLSNVPVPILETPLVKTPALAGFLRPLILLPIDLRANLSPGEIDLILEHELMHLKRRDLAFAWLAHVLACLHWFNPLAWIALRQFRIECELACDEAVLRDRPADERQLYGRTILALVERCGSSRRLAGALCMASGERSVRRRIAAIVAGTSQRSRWWSLLAVLLLLALAAVTLTGPKRTTALLSPISSADSAGAVTRIYDIRDLIIEIPNFSPPDSPIPAINVQFTRQQLIHDLMIKITSSVDPLSWRENTGAVGTIRQEDGQFIITQSPLNHERIQRKLEELRGGARSVQLTIEMRVISPPPDNFFTPDQGQWISLNQGEAALWPHFLDRAQCDALLRATEVAHDSTLITAPRMTLFNGQRAYVLVSRQTAYVKDLTKITSASQEIAFNPEIGKADSGILFDCQATASDDRKYVTLALRPKLTTLLDITPALWRGAPPGRTDLVVQVPHIRETALDTTITMPDNMTAVYRLRSRQNPPATRPSKEPISLLLFKPTIIVQTESHKPATRTSTASK